MSSIYNAIVSMKAHMIAQGIEPTEIRMTQKHYDMLVDELSCMLTFKTNQIGTEPPMIDGMKIIVEG